MKNTFGILLFIALALTGRSQQPQLFEDLSLKYLAQIPPHGAEGAPVILLLHGYGSDEKDLFSFKNVLPPDYLIISARAPYSLPNGGYQWFDDALVNGQHNPNPSHVEHSRVAILKFITEITNKYQANPDLVYVIGFSQGAMMSYEAGLTAPAKVKGIGVLSGRLFATLRPLIRRTPELEQMKIFIAHGTADQRIPYAEATDANDYLLRVKLKPEFHTYPNMAHQISNDELSDLVKWLNQ